MNDVKSMKKGSTQANTKNCQCFSVRKNFILYVLLNCLRCWYLRFSHHLVKYLTVLSWSFSAVDDRHFPPLLVFFTNKPCVSNSPINNPQGNELRNQTHQYSFHKNDKRKTNIYQGYLLTTIFLSMD